MLENASGLRASRRNLNMVGNHWRKMSPRLLGTAALVIAPLLAGCPGGGFPGGGGCPANLNDPQAVMKANFGLQGELEGKVKAALAAGANLKQLAGQIEGDVTLACGNLAKDL